MERKDFIDALGAVAKIRETIMKDCATRTGFDSHQVTTVRMELDTIDALEKARLALVELRDYLMLYPNE